MSGLRVYMEDLKMVKRCPYCGSTDVIEWDDGYLCRECGEEFGDRKAKKNESCRNCLSERRKALRISPIGEVREDFIFCFGPFFCHE